MKISKPFHAMAFAALLSFSLMSLCCFELPDDNNNSGTKYVVRRRDSDRWCVVRASDAYGGDYPNVLGTYNSRDEAERARDRFKQENDAESGLHKCQN